MNTALNVELDHGYAVCRLKTFQMWYWIVDANDMQYVDVHTDIRMYVRTYVRTYVHTDKFSTLHTSVELAHTCPIIHDYSWSCLAETSRSDNDSSLENRLPTVRTLLQQCPEHS